MYSISEVSLGFPNLGLMIVRRLFLFLNLQIPRRRANTVGINPILSDSKGPGTSKLDWRCTWNTIKLIGMNSRFALIHKKAQEQKLLKN